MVCKTCGSDGGPSEVALPLTSETSTCGTCSQPTASCNCEAFCEEDHIQRIVYKRYGFTLRVKPSFVWPALEESVTLQVEGVDRLSPGSLLWNPNAGYLHVVSFDFANQTVIAKNEGESCNIYTGGETLPECTDFVVGPPTCGTGSTPIPNIPYLAADFISTAGGECALAAVTNILGLTVNDVVSVNGYEYRIGNIVDSSTIQLCNDGDGAPAGTVIQWDDDGDNISNIPVLVTASENPCTRDGIAAGVILACDGGNVAKPLTGSVGGQIPVWNDITARFELKNIAAPYTVCTALTADLVLDPVHVGSYIITVNSTVSFIATNTVIINNVFYTVNSVDDATTMHITPFATPVAVETLSAGTPVCLDFNPNLVLSGNLVSSGYQTTVVNRSLNTNNISFTLVNISPSRQMKTLVNYWSNEKLTILPAGGAGQSFINININGAGFVNKLGFNLEFYEAAADNTFKQRIWNETYVTSPGGSLSIVANSEFDGGVGGIDTAASSVQLVASYLAVAV